LGILEPTMGSRFVAIHQLKKLKMKE